MHLTIGVHYLSLRRRASASNQTRHPATQQTQPTNGIKKRLGLLDDLLIQLAPWLRTTNDTTVRCVPNQGEIMRRFLLASVAALSAVTFGVFGGGGTASAQEDKNIVEIASANPDFSTLVAAVTAAGLAETLSGPGPFTVFAPTNAAFEALPAGTVDTLLKDPTGDLAAILKLHVISGAVDSKAAIAAAGGNVDSLGGKISIALDGEKLIVGGATVTTADLKASNGIIHVIDAVITKPAAAAEEVATDSTEAAAEVPPDTTEAEAGAEAETADAPTAVETGDDGLAATSSGTSTLVLVAAGLGLSGLIGSSVALARKRRR